VTRRRPRPAAPPRTVFEEAAIAMCTTINGQDRCACERSPSVCDVMVRAARRAVQVAAPDAFVEIERDDNRRRT
jgi:hypothetical protein